MWITVLVMALLVSLEPFRIGMTVLMLNRPRPTLHLLALLLGGFAMGTTVGLVVLFVLRPRLSGSAHFTLPKVQIVIGVLALLVAAILATNVLSGRFERPYTALRARQLVHGRSLWVSGAAGLGLALPSVDYLAVLAIILASGAAPMTQAGALLMFNVVAFALVEVPLVAFLLAPERTRALMAALHDWLRSWGSRAVAALLAGLGCVLLAAGLAGL
jgi:Sap, sulfolipid-1-addressing protein